MIANTVDYFWHAYLVVDSDVYTVNVRYEEAEEAHPGANPKPFAWHNLSGWDVWSWKWIVKFDGALGNMQL
jgi:hypothetical protein